MELKEGGADVKCPSLNVEKTEALRFYPAETEKCIR
jgi:hypothetical protein